MSSAVTVQLLTAQQIDDYLASAGGHLDAYHSSPEQQARDHYRQRYIEADGWTVIRFTAKVVYHRRRLTQRQQ